jgi:tetratricopeptide (TPR) repeat protein
VENRLRQDTARRLGRTSILDRVWPPAVVIALIVVAYADSLFGGFTSDDLAMIVDNEGNMGSFEAVSKFFMASVWEFSSFETGDRSLYRPAWLLWHFLNYNINGQQPFGWHLGNVALHTLNVFLVASLIRRLLPETSAREQYLAAALFAVHPALTQSVAWITGSTDILLTTAFLAGFLSYLRFCETGLARHLALTGLWYGVAVLSKEAGFIFPFVVIAYDLSRGQARKGLPFLAYAILFAIACIYLLARTLALHAVLQPGSSQFEISIGSISRFTEYALLYARHLVVPLPVPYYLRHVPGGIAEWYELGFGAVVAAGLLCALFHRRMRFPVIWMVFTLAIPLLLALHDNGRFAARFLYLPAAGGAVVVAALLLGLSSRWSIASTSVVTGVAVLFAMLSYSETLTWQSQETWARNVIAFDPKGSIGWVALATYYQHQEDDDMATRTYREGIEQVAPTSEKAKIAEALGLHFADSGRFAESLEVYQWISAQEGSEEAGLLGVGNNYFMLGRYNDAFDAYERARKFAPTNPLLLFNLGLLSERLGRDAEAAGYYLQLLRLAPNWNNKPALAQARRFLAVSGR